MSNAQQHIAAIRAALEIKSADGSLRSLFEERRAFIDACHPEAMRAILAHIEALEADAERLDWMIFHSASVEHARDAEFCKVKWWDGGEERTTAPFGCARAAIGAARKESS